MLAFETFVRVADVEVPAMVTAMTLAFLVGLFTSASDRHTGVWVGAQRTVVWAAAVPSYESLKSVTKMLVQKR